jgi:hypothetical protein
VYLVFPVVAPIEDEKEKQPGDPEIAVVEVSTEFLAMLRKLVEQMGLLQGSISGMTTATGITVFWQAEWCRGTPKHPLPSKCGFYAEKPLPQGSAPPLTTSNSMMTLDQHGFLYFSTSLRYVDLSFSTATISLKRLLNPHTNPLKAIGWDWDFHHMPHETAATQVW